MNRLNSVDLQILYLGIKNGGRFNEKDLGQSDMKNLGVGRILDELASLKERKLIKMNSDGSFSVTTTGECTIWNNQIPLWIRILKILEIKPQDIERISSYLLTPQDQVQREIDDLRKKQLVLMSPLRNNTGIVKMYEILPDGMEEIKNSQNQGATNKPDKIKPQVEIWSIIEEVIEEIKDLKGISEEEKSKIVSKISKIKDKLEI